MEIYRMVYDVEDFNRYGGSIKYFMDMTNPYDFLGLVHDVISNVYSRNSRDFGLANKYYINKIPNTSRNVLNLKEFYSQITSIVDSNKGYLDVLVDIKLFDDILVVSFAKVETNLTVDEFKHHLSIKEKEGERVPSEIYKLIEEFVELRKI